MKLSEFSNQKRLMNFPCSIDWIRMTTIQFALVVTVSVLMVEASCQATILPALQDSANKSVSGFENDDLTIEDFVFENPENEDPQLPRYLCIGDSISSNYGKAITDLHAGKINAIHPAENCQSSAYGLRNLEKWLGADRDPGKQWDVISFNFGHWDANETKANYQANLRAIIARLKQTNAKLIWVTTCPVPDGFAAHGQSNQAVQSPGRRAGVMRDLLNPWAIEVIDQFPEITICDQWQFVYENRKGIYKDWWQGDDVHFTEAPAYSLGRLLAHHVMEQLGLYRPPGFLPTGTIELLRPSVNEEPWRPAAYQEVRSGEFYSEEATLNALPDRWKNIKRLSATFPKDFPIKLSSKVPDEHGWNYDLAALPNHLRLAAIKRQRQLGFGLEFYDELFDSSSRSANEIAEFKLRQRFGPGLSGDEFLKDVRSTRAARVGTSQFRFAIKNVSAYYDLYRISRDRYYSEQIIKYAQALSLFANNHESKDDLLTNGDSDEGLDAALVWAQVNAARLLLEQVRIDRGGKDDSRLEMAKGFLMPVARDLNLRKDLPYESPFRIAEQIASVQFVPGRNSRWLVDERRVPARIAQSFEYEAWHKTMPQLAIFTAAIRGLEELQGIEGTLEFKGLIETYRRSVAAALELFQRENVVVVLAGPKQKQRVPFFFQSSLPMQDGQRTTRSTHPVFEGETIGKSISIAKDLAYIWEANQSFGCPTALLIGQANSIAENFSKSTSAKDGHLYPRDRVDSPWFLAATGREGQPAETLAPDAIFLSAFAPQILQAHRQWTSQREPSEEIELLKAGWMYREWKRRSQH